MRRRISYFLSFVIAIVLCVPSVSVSADSQFKVYTTDSVDGYYSGTFQGQNGSVDISSEVGYLYRVSSDSLVVTNYQDLYDKFPSSFFESDYWFIYNGSVDGSSTSFYGVSFEASSPVSCVFGSGAFTGLYCGSLNPFVMSFYSYDSNSDSFIVSSSQNSSTPSGYQYQGIQVTTFNTQLYSLLDFYNVPFYCNIEWGTYSQYDAFTGMMSSILIHDNEYGFTNFADPQLSFWNGQNIVNPEEVSSVESNENHLFLNNVDAGFCKPAAQNDLSGAGGGYFYISYNFDSWINSHHGDYYLEFVSLIGVDGTQYGRTQNIDLDLGGVNILPFISLSDNDSWTNNALLFVEYPAELTSNFNYGYVYSMPYTKFIATDYEGVTNKDKLGKFRINEHTWSYGPARGTGNMINRLLLTPLGGRTYDISTMSFGEYLASLFGNVNHNSFVIDVQFSLVDRVSGEKSGVYRKSFDLLNGVVNLQSNSIKDNNNPYIPQDDELSLVDYDSNGGYLPSLTTGDNNQIVNFSTPDNIKLFIDNGFSEFLHWYETSADTAYATNRFWSSMGIFEGNPATDLYSEYFGFLPDDFKTLIFSCAGIGIVGGAFCILRRRLH